MDYVMEVALAVTESLVNSDLIDIERDACRRQQMIRTQVKSEDYIYE